MDVEQAIKQFLTSKAYGVVGTSKDRNKYGNKVLRCYLQKDKKVYPIHPKEKSIEGVECLQNIADLPNNVESLSVITPPAVTEKIVDEAITKGIKNVWMQPGAESNFAVQKCKNSGINVIAGGPCLLVTLGYRE